MTPSKPYPLIRAIRAYDDSLRLRWGRHQELWIVERQLPPRHKQLLAERPNPWKSKRGLDRYDGWIAGYVHVLSVHPVLADNVPLVMEYITEADIWRRGGIEKVNQALEAQDAEQERAEDYARHHFHEAAGSEAYDRLAWLQKRRVTVPENVAEVLEPDDGA